ncbi:Sec23/Sec24 family protein [Xylona heveae TC161]|uniref:Sec23/Sec24 family protein n=1 Tax=Xylona heveae (strain CBS 132557 / TC161) TaxID=1328760 RepID=A0A165G5G2_XYLHT|nr:Sec23/Sec24 family protein [Xylona heveae TC161]KZF21760.1 Sec23/Sec24 family protein [Xylona heveae TC161]
MSDFQMYHALGQGDPNGDPNHPGVQGQVPTQQFHAASSPYSVGLSEHNQPSPNVSQHYQSPQYTGQQQYASHTAAQGYFPEQPLAPHGGVASDGKMVQQTGGLAMGGEAHGSVRPHKKKDRHAYHNLEPAGSSQAFNGVPANGLGSPSQFLSSTAPAAQIPTTPYSPGLAAPGAPQVPGIPSGSFAPIAGHPSVPQFAAPPNFAGAHQPIAAGPTSGSQQNRVDPEQIPSIPRSRDVPAQYYLDHVYPTMEHHLPPPAAVSYISYDQGNASPKLARLSLNNIPSTLEALSSTGLPLGLILQPLGPLQPGEQTIPVLDFGETGPPRCRRCRTYINPFMTFRSGGNTLVCNMCTFPNEVSPEYFAPTDPSGVRVDRTQRPELTMGTVEFMVPKEYWAKEPIGLRWLFLIDVSQEALNKGFLEAFCEGILGALYGEADDATEAEKAEGRSGKGQLPAGSKIGIITFDKEIHFYNLKSNLEQAQMMVMTDIEDPFVPLSEGLFVDPQESKSVITSLLTQIPALFSQVKNPEPALLPTLNAALSALSSTGGKIVCSLSSLPTWGPGRLFLRDNQKVHHTDAEKKLFTTEHPGFRKTASKMVECGVGVDMFLAAAGGGYLDVATVGHISSFTGGETFYYSNFHAPRDCLKLSKEIKHSVTRETGYQALMKVRCSNGLQVSSYHGNFVQHSFGADLEFGVIDEDKSIAVLFSYDGKLDPKLDAHFQSALLYTTATGERRVRCSNVVASVSEGGTEVMRFIDQDAVVNIIAKEAASRMTERTLKEIRGGITEKTVDILAGYRKNFSGSHPPGQLVLPENLKEFSMYILSLLKSRAFKGGQEPSDRRVHDMRMIKSMGVLELSLYLYPRIIPIHNLHDQDGFPNENGHLRMPPTIRASFSRIEEGGAYIVDNGQVCLLWIHSQVSPNLLVDLFGESYTSLQSLDPQLSSLPILETHLNAQVRNILQYLSIVRGSKALTIQLARQGFDGSEYEFARLLVEDRNNEAQSYVDWLVHVHRQIQLELAGHRKKDESLDNLSTSFAAMRAFY